MSRPQTTYPRPRAPLVESAMCIRTIVGGCLDCLRGAQLLAQHTAACIWATLRSSRDASRAGHAATGTAVSLRSFRHPVTPSRDKDSGSDHQTRSLRSDISTLSSILIRDVSRYWDLASRASFPELASCVGRHDLHVYMCTCALPHACAQLGASYESRSSRSTLQWLPGLHRLPGQQYREASLQPAHGPSK